MRRKCGLHFHVPITVPSGRLSAARKLGVPLLHERSQVLISDLWRGLSAVDGLTVYGPADGIPARVDTIEQGTRRRQAALRRSRGNDGGSSADHRKLEPGAEAFACTRTSNHQAYQPTQSGHVPSRERKHVCPY